MFTNRNLALIIAGLIVVVAGTHYVFTEVGRSSGEVAKERIMLVWPDFMKLEPRDRALIGSLAISCRVEEQPTQEDAVVECLRRELASNRAVLPTGLDQESATKRLDQLLSERH